MDNKKFLITDYLKGKEAFGESEAVKVEAIAKSLEMSEDEVKEKVRQERIDGMIICCGAPYFPEATSPYSSVMRLHISSHEKRRRSSTQFSRKR